MTRHFPLTPEQARVTADALYRCLCPVSQIAGTRAGARHVIALYLEYRGSLALMHKHPGGALTLVERWPPGGIPVLERAQIRYHDYWYQVFGRHSDAQPIVHGGMSAEDELWLWRALAAPENAEFPSWDEALLEVTACQVLVPWIEQDARAQGRPQPACWPLSHRIMAHASRAGSALQGVRLEQARVWAFLLREVGDTCQEGSLDALSLLAEASVAAPLRFGVERFLQALQHEVAQGIAASVRGRMQAAVNSGQLHRALTSMQSPAAQALPVRYSLTDLVLHGLLLRAAGLRTALSA